MSDLILKPKILIVDDQPENLFALELLLKNVGAVVYKALSGNEALSLTLDNNFSLILLDIKMPDMDGYEVARLLRGDSKSRHIPIIFITANNLEEDNIFEGYEAGAIDYIMKPIQPRILNSKVSIFLDLYKYNQQIILNRDLKYRELFNNIYDMVFLHEIAGGELKEFLEVNDAACKILGYSREELQKMSPKDLDSPEARVNLSSISMELDSKGDACFETVHIKKDGSRICIEINAHVFSMNGNRYILAVGRDISERKRMEKELLEMNKKLEEKVKEEVAKNRKKDYMMLHQSKMASMGEMVGFITHQWKQPLNTLSLVIQNMQNHGRINGLKMENVDKSVEKMMNLIGFMSQTINDFQGFYKSNKQLQNFYLETAIQETLRIMEASLTVNSIKVNLKLEKDLLFNGFSNEFRQVLLNLISNSRDALVERRISVPIIEVETLKTLEKICVFIRDNAGGLSKEALQHLFTPYFTTKEGGTGIGLYLSKIIIEQNMGGKLSALNTQNGAEFVIEI